MASKKHDFTKIELLAGALVIASALVLFMFIALIKGMRPPQQVKTYYAKFSNIIGLNNGADVRFGGVKVGRVINVLPDPGDQSQIRVEAEVFPTTPVNEETVATVGQTTLTADKHLELSTGKPGARKLDSGETVKAITTSGGMIDLPDLTGVISRTQSLLDDVKDFLGVQDAKDLESQGKQEFARLSRVTADVRGTLDQSTGMITDLRKFMDEQKPNLNKIITQVDGLEKSSNDLIAQLDGILKDTKAPITDTLAKTQALMGDLGHVVKDTSKQLESLMKTLDATLKNTESLTGGAQSFLDDNRPALEDILVGLRDTLRNLETFSQTLAEQPQAVIRGKQPVGRK